MHFSLVIIKPPILIKKLMGNFLYLWFCMEAQLVEKDLEAAIILFQKAINVGDKLDSAVKDMAVVMKQLDRT